MPDFKKSDTIKLYYLSQIFFMSPTPNTPENTPFTSNELKTPENKAEAIIKGASEQTRELLNSINGNEKPARAPDTSVNSFEKVKIAERKEAENEREKAEGNLSLIEAESSEWNIEEVKQIVSKEKNDNVKWTNFLNEDYIFSKLLPANFRSMINREGIIPGIAWTLVGWVDSALTVAKVPVALITDAFTLPWALKEEIKNSNWS